MIEPAPSTAEELVQRARDLLQQQKPDEAWQCLEESLKIKKTAPALRNLGNILFRKRDVANAILYFRQALQVDANDHAANAMLAEAYFALGDASQALGFSVLAIEAEPKEIRYKERFVFMSQQARFRQHSDVIENAILACLQTPNLDCAALQSLWYSTFTLNPVYQPVYRVTQGGGIFSAVKGLMGKAATVKESADSSFDAAAFAKVTDFTPLLRPFFLQALEKITVYSRPFEEFLTLLRRALLLQPERFTPLERLAIAAPLAHYCANTEYIFDITPEEIAALPQRDDSPANVALRGCYGLLYASEEMRAMAEKHASVPEMASLVQVQVGFERALDEARKTIPALTPIADDVSIKVREQYEESPYPKWKTVPRNLTIEPLAASLRKPGAKILIAGCGTGHEAAQIASVLPEADILAVDLSLSSLAYAKLQTASLGFKNIRFAQADILQLGVIPDRFDAIISGGVLHHLRDPLAGWQVLTGLLNPDGLMRIALYSKTARQHITAAREAVARGKYPATPEGMRAFRRKSPELLGREALGRLMAVSDYYHISMYRDMVFHVQEHCFDIPGLEAALKRLQLGFLKFILPQAVAAQYHAAFPNDPEEVSLGNWHKFEQAQPDTFLGMYQFWCRKN